MVNFLDTPKKCLVTGGCGFIGSQLVKSLMIKGHDVTVMDDLSTGNLMRLPTGFKNSNLWQESVLNTEFLKEQHDYWDVIFHLAAIPSVRLSLVEPKRVFEVCATGTANILDLAARTGSNRVIIASSSAVYGKALYCSEVDTVLEPVSAYGAGKMSGDYLARSYSICANVPTICLRLFNVYGPGQRIDSEYSAVIPKFLDWMIADQNPTIFGDGLQVRDFIYIDDVVKAFLTAADFAFHGYSDMHHIFNIGTGRAVSILELFKQLRTLLNMPQIVPHHIAGHSGEARRTMAEITKMVFSLGFTPAVPLEEGLKRTIEWYKANQIHYWSNPS